MAELTRLSDLVKDGPVGARRFVEFSRAKDLSCGFYLLPADGEDHQSPHTEDEVYYILAGSGQIRVAGEDRAVRAGSIVYVKTGDDHRFHTITEELRILVIFAPARRSRAAAS